MVNAERVYEAIQKLTEEERIKLDHLLGVVPEMGREEQAALDAEIERSLDEVDAGRCVDADELIAKLQARSA